MKLATSAGNRSHSKCLTVRLVARPINRRPVLTAVDDGTIAMPGLLVIDDESNEAQRTVLIKDGVLQQYLSDRVGQVRWVSLKRFSGRESYKYAPV